MNTVDDLIAELRREGEEKERRGQEYLREAAAILATCDEVTTSIGNLIEQGVIG